jgi:hypothetical protein
MALPNRFYEIFSFISFLLQDLSKQCFGKKILSKITLEITTYLP